MSESFFYNASVNNRTPGTIINCDYIDSRNAPLMPNASQYRVGVIRFSIPTSQIPLFKMDHSDVDGAPSVPVALNHHVVTLRRVNNYFTDENNDNADADADGVNPNFKYFEKELADLGEVRTVQSYLEALNTAFAAAYTDLQAEAATHAVRYGDSTAAPAILFDQATQLFEMQVQEDYINNVAVPITIYASEGVNRLFGQMGQPVPGPFGIGHIVAHQWVPTDFRYNRKELVPFGFSNGRPGYRNIQEMSSFPLWSSLASVRITAFGMATTNEYIPSITVDTAYEAKGNNLFSSPLSDFIPVMAAPDGLNLQYFASTNIKWYSLTSDMPIQHLNIKVTFTTDTGETRSVKLAYLENFQCKLEFRNKSLAM
jgi:hypothetical protein